ncbi:GMC family oxidoreductase N-terminal domain-containing protein [Sphingopyxis granuli]|uniref:GMC family oxidoreductase n=1 Tax=Sphingopyxis granuli TaxID=267128 RepID=UPI001F52BF72|nr:GMC family oxidoreductase N-terminal domain-containing protein [Sphingopyxis granuli]UNK79163.1 GMC family oxidoreductase N-terminal domain-containing protein [Sphingopyxis granuli]
MTYDYIVIGGGSAGCVVAARLSERPNNRVLLLESGGRDTSLLLKMPLAFPLLRDTPLDWGYDTDPEPFAADRIVPTARGKVLGGSSSVNGMMYSRGHPRDYDQWRQMGAEGWSYDDVLPYFRKSESNWRGESPVHGGDGPLKVTPYTSDEPISQAIKDAAGAAGYRVLDDFEGGDPEGFALPDSTIYRGRRASASKAFLESARRRPNLDIVIRAHVLRILIERGRAAGVEYLKGGVRHTVRADREIVLSGGAYASPQILMLSGIGPADHLQSLGIPVELDLPGVGAELQEHPLVPMGFRLKKPLRFTQRLRADRLALAGLGWLLTGRGLPSVPLSCIAYYKSRLEVERPDLETIFMATNMMAQPWFPGWRKPQPDALTTMSVALRPGSRGFVRLRSADPLDRPRIRLNFLQDPDDLRLLRHATRWTRDFVRNAPLADHVGDELFPGTGLGQDAELDAFIRHAVTVGQHPVGTCRMGNDDQAVVDPALRLRGIAGLRIADASVMPALIGGHTNAPSMMIGEKAADMMMAN